MQLYINNSSAGAYKTLTAKIAANQKSTLTIRNKIATLNGVSDTLSYYAAGGSPLLIPYSTQSYCATAKYYYIKGTRSSTTSSTFNFEFIPCINPSGIVGFYDLVSTTFIKPTAGTFIAGPAV